jgi:hypothetical protein
MANLEYQYDPNIEKDFVEAFSQKWKQCLGGSATPGETLKEVEVSCKNLSVLSQKNTQLTNAIKGIRQSKLSQYYHQEKELMDGFNQALKDSLGDCVTPVKDIDDAYRFFKKASEVLQEKKYMV